MSKLNVTAENRSNDGSKQASEMYYAKAIEQTLEHILIVTCLVQILGCSKVVGRLI